MINPVYKENIRKTIKQQLNWANAEEGEARIEFLDYIINYCEKLKKSNVKKRKQKTRYGASSKEDAKGNS